jgi:hypothetical protein
VKSTPMGAFWLVGPIHCHYLRLIAVKSSKMMDFTKGNGGSVQDAQVGMFISPTRV